MKTLVLAAAAVLMSTSALAQEAAAPAAPSPTEPAATPADAEPALDPRFVEYPVWLPRDQPRGSLYPEKAMARGLSGAAEAVCTVKENGRLEKCTIESEAPKGFGFGDALISVTRLMKMKPLDEDGAATAGKLVRIPFEFKIPK